MHGDIDCVVVGLNTAATLRGCLESIRSARYSYGKVTIIYVDGGSKDGSVEIAREFLDVKIAHMEKGHVSAAAARNAGWKLGTSPIVQFLDSDTTLSDEWFDVSVKALEEDVGAVFGRREEKHPDSSRYNAIGDFEWNPPVGETTGFFGDVMIRRSVLEETGGFNEKLMAAEGLELGNHIRENGFKILHIDQAMTTHDLAMFHWMQYWQRAFKQGYGMATALHYAGEDQREFWVSKLLRILLCGLGTLILLVLGILGGIFFATVWLILLIPAAIVLLYPRIFHVDTLSKEYHIPKERAAKYAWHRSFVVVPQSLGAIGFFWKKLFRKK